MLDAGEQLYAGHGRGHVGAVGHGRDGIAEERAGADGAGSHHRVNIQAQADTGQRQTCRAKGAPGRAGDHRANCGQQERRQQEGVGRNGLHTDADDGGNRTGGHPGTYQTAHRQNDHDGDNGLDAVGVDTRSDLLPCGASGNAKQDRHQPGDQKQCVDLCAPDQCRNHDNGEYRHHHKQRVAEAGRFLFKVQFHGIFSYLQ